MSGSLTRRYNLPEIKSIQSRSSDRFPSGANFRYVKPPYVTNSERQEIQYTPKNYSLPSIQHSNYGNRSQSRLPSSILHRQQFPNGAVSRPLIPNHHLPSKIPRIISNDGLSKSKPQSPAYYYQSSQRHETTNINSTRISTPLRSILKHNVNPYILEELYTLPSSEYQSQEQQRVKSKSKASIEYESNTQSDYTNFKLHQNMIPSNEYQSQESIEPIIQRVKTPVSKHTRQLSPLDLRDNMSTNERYQLYRSKSNASIEYEPYTQSDYTNLKSRYQNMKLPRSLGPSEDSRWQVEFDKRQRMRDYSESLKDLGRMRRAREVKILPLVIITPILPMIPLKKRVSIDLSRNRNYVDERDYGDYGDYHGQSSAYSQHY